MTDTKERLDMQTCQDFFQSVLHNQRFDFVLQQTTHVERALEIGTGLGSFSPILAARCDKYTGIEFDPESAAITAKRLGPNANVIQGDARNLPFEPKMFSVIVCLEVLEHLGDYKAGVRGIHRCMKEDGVGVISVPFRKRGGKSSLNPYHLYEPGERELTEYLKKHFHDVEVYYQYFPETPMMSTARHLHLRRLLGLDKLYAELSKGDATATSKLRIDPEGDGLKLHLVLVVKRPRSVPLT